MPNNEIDMRDSGGLLIGKVILNENPTRLNAQRTADGFNLSLPMKLMLRLVGQNDPVPMISNLRGEIFAGTANSKTEIGTAIWDSWFIGAQSDGKSGGMCETEVSMTWRESSASLAYYERLRDGGIPKLEISIHGELCYFVTEPNTGRRLRTQPESIVSNSRSLTVSYPKEAWVHMLQSIGAAENVLVEIPLPGRPSPDWDGVWSALIDARNAVEQGGSTGWKGCVTAVRLALEKWRDIEKEQMGAGWKAPSLAEREARTKRERLDNIRWHLLQVAHLGAHTGADEWTRDDALLMLSTISALLAERKP